jgi:hypothetical protein
VFVKYTRPLLFILIPTLPVPLILVRPAVVCARA